MNTKVMAALVSVGLLAGCSGGGGGGNYKTVAEVRAALEKADLACTEYEQNKGVVGAREDGTCKINGESTSITVYNSADQREQIRKAFSALASGISIDGDVWTVGVDTNELAKKVQSALGGKIK